jgi:hypothetical protein
MASHANQLAQGQHANVPESERVAVLHIEALIGASGSAVEVAQVDVVELEDVALVLQQAVARVAEDELLTNIHRSQLQEMRTHHQGRPLLLHPSAAQ